MKIGILGTGMVGQTIGAKLVALGHDVVMGSREAKNPKARAWAKKAGKGAGHGTFADAALHGELIFNCTSGTVSLAVIEAAGKKNFAGKILIDVSNPLEKGWPPPSAYRGEDSVGEQLQKALPKTHVVKSLNTVNCTIMVDPSLVPGEHDIFVGGNSKRAKAKVTKILREWFGWKSVVDLGGIESSRGAEAFVLFWVQLYGAMGGPDFNVHVAKGKAAK